MIVAILFLTLTAQAEEKMAGTLGDLLKADVPAIATRGGGKKNSRVSVNGCSKEAHFTLNYVADVDKIPLEKTKCQEFDMHGKLAAFMNQNLESCLELAGDRAIGHGALTTDLRAGGNKIYHDGCLGDARHQRGGSWHNEALALDVIAVRIGGRLFRYEDTVNPKTKEARQTDDFFVHFRRCWAKKVLAYDDSCKDLGKERTGSVGKENSDHHHHLHLSLPCRGISSGRASNLASLTGENHAD